MLVGLHEVYAVGVQFAGSSDVVAGPVGGVLCGVAAGGVGMGLWLV